MLPIIDPVRLGQQEAEVLLQEATAIVQINAELNAELDRVNALVDDLRGQFLATTTTAQGELSAKNQEIRHLKEEIIHLQTDNEGATASLEEARAEVRALQERVEEAVAQRTSASKELAEIQQQVRALSIAATTATEERQEATAALAEVQHENMDLAARLEAATKK